MKRIISTILTISMLFTMIPAFASDIETADVNNNVQLFSVGSGEAVIKQSAKQLTPTIADFEEQEVGDLTANYSGNNHKFVIAANTGIEKYAIEQAEDNKFITFNNEAGNYTSFSSTRIEGSLVSSDNIIFGFKIKFNLPVNDWLAVNVTGNGGMISGSYFDGERFGVNYGGDYANNQAAKDKYGATTPSFFNVVTDMWYTLVYDIDIASQTYDLTVTDENNNVITSTTQTRDGSDPMKDIPFRKAGSVTKGGNWSIVMPHDSKNAADTSAGSYSVDDVMSYPVEKGLFFKLIGSETLTDDGDMRIEYTNTTGADEDVCVTYVALEDGVVVDVDEDIVTLTTEDNVADVDVTLDTADCTGVVTYEAFITDPATGGTMCTPGSREGTSDPENFVTASEANGQIVVSVKKDSAYDMAVIRIYDEDENLVGIKEQKISNSPISFDVKNYNQEYTADVTLTDAVGKCVYAKDSIIVWNPAIAEDFNNDPETAFVTHIDALNKAYEGFEDIYNINPEYINNYIMLRNDYTSVHDVAETVVSLGDFLEIIAAEDEDTFTLAFEANALSLGIEIGDVYLENKDLFISALYENTDDETLPEDFVDIYNDIYVTAAFNVAPEISYGSLFKKYADVLGITVDSKYTNGEATINGLVNQYKEENGGFEDADDIAVAFKKAMNNAVDPVGYETIGISPNYPEVDVIDFEELEPVENVSTSLSGNGYSVEIDVEGGMYSVVEENGNKHINLTAPEKTKRAVEFRVSGKDCGEKVQISTKFRMNKISNWLLLYIGNNASCLNVRDGYFKENWGAAAAPDLNSKPVEAGIWYNITWIFDIDLKTYDLYIVNADDPSEVIVDMSGINFRNQNITKNTDISSICFSTSSENSTESDIAFDDISIGAAVEDALVYKAKGSSTCVSGTNGIAVNLKNLTSDDKDINIYVPVYVNGELYTVANERLIIASGKESDIVVDFELDAEQAADAEFSVVVADSLDGYNYGISSSTTAGTLAVDATADYENDVINVTTENTFDNCTIIVLKPLVKLADANPEDVLYYAAGNKAEVKLADGVFGDLNVYAVAQDAEGNVTDASDTIYYPGNGAAKELIKDFSEVTDENVTSVVLNYMGIINAVEPGMVTFYNENSAEVNAALVANKPYTSTEQVINTIKSVKALKALKAATSEAEFEVAFNDFADMFEVELDSIYNANKAVFISAMYADKDNLNTYEDVMNAYDGIYMICDMNTATEDNIGAKLAEYASDLGITFDDVYTSKQVYIDRLMVADIPFADKDAIVSSYNNAYAKAEVLEGDFSKKVVSESAQQFSKYIVDFEDLDLVSGVGSAPDMPFSFTSQGDGTFDITSDDNNKYLVFRQNANSGSSTTGVGFAVSSYFGDYTTVQYDIKFNSINGKWTMLNLGGISSLYMSGNKFNLNETETGASASTKTISDVITRGVWYTVKYTINVPDESYNITIKDENDVEIANHNTKFRNWKTTEQKSGSLSLFTSQSDPDLCEFAIDNVMTYASPDSGTVYSITGTTTLLPGSNTFVAEIQNADATDNIYGIYVPMYSDGKLISVSKTDITVSAKSTVTADVEIVAPTAGSVDYRLFVVEKLEGENYGVSSNAVLPRTTTPAQPIADYTTRSIKVSGTTTYDNMSIIVTAPTADSSVYDIEAANTNPDVIAYYDVAELKKISSAEKDAATGDTVVTYSFATDIMIPDKFVDGEYNVYYISQNKAGEVVPVRKSVYYAGSSKLDNMLTDFNAITDANVEATINRYMDVLLGVTSDMDAFYAANKATVNEAVVAGKPYTNVGNINNTIFAIYAADKLKNALDVDTFKSTLEYYSNVFGIDTTSTEYIEGAAEINDRLFKDRANITKLNLNDKFADALMLSEFNNATREDVPAVLDKYASKLGITVDGTYIEGIKKAIAADGVVFNSAQDVIAAYNTGLTITDTNSTPTPSAPVGGGGGGGGGGGSSTIQAAPGVPYVESQTSLDGTASDAVFADLDSVSWAVEAITELKKIGVINGVSATEFAPNREVTREEFAKMIVNAFSIKGEGKSFADVPATAWYAPYVTALASSGIVNGISDTKFGVGAKITRQDAAVILDRTALNTGVKYEHKTSALNIFNDYISDYAVDSVYRLYQNSVINGTSATTFSATATLTRAQAAKMIYSLMQLK